MSGTVWPVPVISLTDTAIFTALRSVLMGILPGIEITRAQINRVPEPSAADFVMMTPITRRRLETNIDDWSDIILIGSIAAQTTDPDTHEVITPTTLTVTATNGAAPIIVGNPLNGTDIADASAVTAFLSGTGGTGTYVVSPDQAVTTGTILAGYKRATLNTEVTVQLDVHGPASAENAQKIATLLRDEYAGDAFTAANPDVVPLYAGDPRQVPFTNAEDQWEYRYIVEAVMQANITITVGQQFADTLAVGLIEVDTTYPG